MIKTATIAIAVFLSIAVFAAIAQTIQSPPGGNPFTGVTNPASGALTFTKWNLGADANIQAVNNQGIQAGTPISFTSNNNQLALMAFDNSNLPGLIMGSGFGISFTTAFSSHADTGISRHATAGILDIGNGTAQSTAGGIQTGNATLVSLTTGTNADFLCLNSGGGILIQTTACTISSLRFKPDWKPYDDNALAKVEKLDVGTFHTQTGPNADPNAKSLQAGLNAEDVARIAPECAVYENDMKTPKSYRQECVIALLVRAIQQIKSSR